MSVKIARKVHISIVPLLAALGIILGVILCKFLVIPLSGAMFIILAAISLSLAFLKCNVTRVLFALLAGLILGYLRQSAVLIGESRVAEYYDKNIIIQARVASDPQTNEGETKFKIDQLRLGDEEISGCEIYVTMKGDLRLTSSDRITLQGKLTDGFGNYVGFL